MGEGSVLSLDWLDLLALERQGVGEGLLIRHRLHSGVAYAATVVYAVNFGWRRRSPDGFAGARLALSLVGAASSLPLMPTWTASRDAGR